MSEAAKQVYEDLECLASQLRGAEGEAALERLLEASLRAVTNPFGSYPREYTRGVARFQNVHYGQPKDPEKGKG